MQVGRPVEAMVLNMCVFHGAGAHEQLSGYDGHEQGDGASGGRDAERRGEFMRMALEITPTLSVSVGRAISPPSPTTSL